MDEKEKLHYLAVLVELQLFPLITALKESNYEDKDKKIKESIEKFKKELPQYLAEIPNVETKVDEMLLQTQQYDEKIKKMQEKNNRKKEIERDEER